MANTDRDLINSAMGGSQDPNQDDYQSAMGGVQAGGSVMPLRALTFNDNTPLQFSDGQYLELAA